MIKKKKKKTPDGNLCDVVVLVGIGLMLRRLGDHQCRLKAVGLKYIISLFSLLLFFYFTILLCSCIISIYISFSLFFINLNHTFYIIVTIFLLPIINICQFFHKPQKFDSTFIKILNQY